MRYLPLFPRQIINNNLLIRNRCTDGGTDELIGETSTVDVSWASLAPGTDYLGAVSHTGDVGLMGLTLIEVDTD